MDTTQKKQNVIGMITVILFEKESEFIKGEFIEKFFSEKFHKRKNLDGSDYAKTWLDIFEIIYKSNFIDFVFNACHFTLQLEILNALYITYNGYSYHEYTTEKREKAWLGQ